MSNAIKILGQQAGVSSQVTLYTVPAGASAVLSSIVVCNRSATTSSPVVKVTHGGTTTQLYGPASYVTKSTVVLAIGATLAAGDLVQVSDLGSSASTDFTAFGVEIA